MIQLMKLTELKVYRPNSFQLTMLKANRACKLQLTKLTELIELTQLIELMKLTELIVYSM